MNPCEGDEQSGHPFSYLSPEQRVPADHPLRTIRAMTDDALRRLSPRFDAIYATTGRPSIPRPLSAVPSGADAWPPNRDHAADGARPESAPPRISVLRGLAGLQSRDKMSRIPTARRCPSLAKRQADPGANTAALKSAILERGITVKSVDDLDGALGTSSGGCIRLLNGLSPATEFTTLVHEYAHTADADDCANLRGWTRRGGLKRARQVGVASGDPSIGRADLLVGHVRSTVADPAAC